MSPHRTLRHVAILTAVVAVAVAAGSCRTGRAVPLPAGEPWSVEIAPLDATNPAGTNHTFVATVRDRAGRPLPDVEVRWLLPRGPGSVGSITAYADEREASGRLRPVRRTTKREEAVSYTNEGPERLDRDADWVPDDREWRAVEVGAGQSWCRVRSDRPGDSQLIACVPTILDPARQKAVGILHWARMPLLRVECRSPRRVRVGDEFDYRIELRNDGLAPTPANVIVETVLPPGVRVVDGTKFPLDLGRREERELPGARGLRGHEVEHRPG